ncbi:MAG TPA: flavin reductase family protein [Nitrospirota bacterium]|nr:flavin reductase family protein [Nitrospirota bacterium]
MPKKSLRPSPYLYPAPVLLISSREESGKPYVATICWAGVVCSEPPLVGMSVRPKRRSNKLIKNDMEFVINIPSRKWLKETDYCGFASEMDADKFSTVGFTAVEAEKVKAPLIKECPLNLECVVKQILSLGSHDLFIAEIVAVHADEDIFVGDEISMEKLSPFAYCPILHEYRAIGDRIGTYGFNSGGTSTK